MVVFCFVINYTDMATKKQPTIKITKEFKAAFEAMEKGDEHIFLTGKAGTGKSTLLKYFREKSKKKHVVLAPTGVAALNVRGQTIHSFFGFHPKITKKMVHRASDEKQILFRNLETIIIDEISMVRADLLDCVDRSLRINRNQMKEPFGGVQMVFIGDLFQLPPVVTDEEKHLFQGEYKSPYFFDAEVMQETKIKIIELQKVHRQKDKKFVELLNNVRAGKVKQEDIEELNKRHDPFYDPTEEDGYTVHLTTTNKMAEQRNAYELKKLPAKEWSLKAFASGEVSERKMPSDPVIKVKEGAKIMFTVNDPEKRWVNGTLGTVVRCGQKGLQKLPSLTVRTEDGKEVEVAHYKWDITEYFFDGKSFEREVVGSYAQFPITLAWAVTIHKAQGKTFDNILVDLGWGAFAHGQTYVALSRCTSLKGVKLMKEFREKDVIVDQVITEFMSKSAE